MDIYYLIGHFISPKILVRSIQMFLASKCKSTRY